MILYKYVCRDRECHTKHKALKTFGVYTKLEPYKNTIQ